MKIVLLLIIGCLGWGQPVIEDFKTLEPDAIVFGNGPNQAYVFIDPLCQHSQSYLDILSTNHALQKENTYYIFLYRLEKFNSDTLIDSIYMAADVKDALINNVVFHNKIPMQTASKKVIDMRQRINHLAKKIGMKRRPYIIIFRAESNSCDVSEGISPCIITNNINE